MTLEEAKRHLCNRKLNGDFSDIANNDLFTDEDLSVWIQHGVMKAWDFKPWDFTEGSKTATTTGDYLDYPEDIQTGSIYLLRVAGKEYKKLIFQDYMKYLEDWPNAKDRIWTEQKRFIFINNAYAVGNSFDVFGKLMPIVPAEDDDLLPFSTDTDDIEHSGNEAIVQLGYAEALDSEKFKDPSQAEIERKKAYQTLDILWKPFADARALLQSKGRPMFNTPDYLGSANSARSSAYNGNFQYLN